MMSLPMVRALPVAFPEAEFLLVIKWEYASLLTYFDIPGIVIPFDKTQYSGVTGQIRFGRMIRRRYQPDIFCSLPDSLSSAIIGYTSGAKVRIGYGGQWRSALLTHAYDKPSGLHRAQEYLYLVNKFTDKETTIDFNPVITPRHLPTDRKLKLLLNINSEASSRRMPIDFATNLLQALINTGLFEIYLSGGPRDVTHVNALPQELLTHASVHNLAGKTKLAALFELIRTMDIALSTDSGIAHVCNALGIPLVVLFGAGDENNTGPVNRSIARVVRLEALHCAPCLSNTCRYNDPVCIRGIQIERIVKELVSSFLVKP